MCCWVVYIGELIYLEDIIMWLDYLLVVQSVEVMECKMIINVDGFGIVWYDECLESGFYWDVYFVWLDLNLRFLVYQVKFWFFLLYVCVLIGVSILCNNCYFFVVWNWIFMYNGQVGGFEQFCKVVDMVVLDDFYGKCLGGMDSEVFFFLVLGNGLDCDFCVVFEQLVVWLESQSCEIGELLYMWFLVVFLDG